MCYSSKKKNLKNPISWSEKNFTKYKNIIQYHKKSIVSMKNLTHPTMGLLKPILVIVSCILLAVFSWGLSRYFKICPTHHTTGSPCSLTSRGARSSGTAKGRNGGLGDRESMIGRFITWVSGFPGQLATLSPLGLMHVSLTGLKISSQPVLWYRQPLDFSMRVRLVPYATMKQYTAWCNWQP